MSKLLSLKYVPQVPDEILYHMWYNKNSWPVPYISDVPDEAGGSHKVY